MSEEMTFEEARKADSVVLHDENGAHPAWWDYWTSQWRTGSGEVLSTEGFVRITKS